MAYSTPPARTALADTYPNPSNAVFRGGVGGLFDYTTGLLGPTGQPADALNAMSIAPVQNANLWINSDMARWQRNTASVADGAYGFDRIVSLCETGSLTLSQQAQPLNGIPYALRMTQPDASPKRMGCLQIIEANDCIAYRGGNMVFALKVRCSAATSIRVALVAWTGTADSPTRDVVNTWSSTNYTASNFFVANTSTIATAATAVSAAAWTDLVVSSASVGGVTAPSGMNNLYLVVWTDTAQAQNVTLDIATPRAGRGTVAPVWTPPSAATELARCLRYFYKFVAPAAASPIGTGFYYGTTTATAYHPLPVLMRTNPNATYGNTGSWTALSPGGAINLGSAAVGASTPVGLEISFAAAALGTSGWPVLARFGNLANFIQADAELGV